MKNKVGLQIILSNPSKFKFFVFTCFFILIHYSKCTQTDYFGVFDIEYTKV